MSRRILVTGGRDNYDYRMVDRAISGLFLPGDTLVHGDAAGIDRLCQQAVYYTEDYTIDRFPAEWKVNGKYNPNAGPERNQLMLESGADLALVFHGGRGTADMFKRLKREGIPIADFQEDGFYGGV